MNYRGKSLSILMPLISLAFLLSATPKSVSSPLNTGQIIDASRIVSELDAVPVQNQINEIAEACKQTNDQFCRARFLGLTASIVWFSSLIAHTSASQAILLKYPRIMYVIDQLNNYPMPPFSKTAEAYQGEPGQVSGDTSKQIETSEPGKIAIDFIKDYLGKLAGERGPLLSGLFWAFGYIFEDVNKNASMSEQDFLDISHMSNPELEDNRYGYSQTIYFLQAMSRNPSTKNVEGNDKALEHASHMLQAIHMEEVHRGLHPQNDPMFAPFNTGTKRGTGPSGFQHGGGGPSGVCGNNDCTTGHGADGGEMGGGGSRGGSSSGTPTGTITMPMP